jgi:hypothetical protein
MSLSRIIEIYGMRVYSSMYRYPGCMLDNASNYPRHRAAGQLVRWATCFMSSKQAGC